MPRLTKAQQIDRAKRLIRSAGGSAKRLELDVVELVSMRAWDILGYENLSEMWEKENGFKCPPFVKVVAIDCFLKEGMNQAGKTRTRKTGHTVIEVARMVGYSVHEDGKGAFVSPAVGAIKRTLQSGVKPENVMSVISNKKPRKTPPARRMGVDQDKLVQEGFLLRRRDADAMMEIAQSSGIPKSELYRQAVAEFLQRHAESRVSRVRKAG